MKVLFAALMSIGGGVLATALYFIACFTWSAIAAQSSGDPTGGGAFAVLFLITSPIAFVVGVAWSVVAIFLWNRP